MNEKEPKYILVASYTGEYQVFIKLTEEQEDAYRLRSGTTNTHKLIRTLTISTSGLQAYSTRHANFDMVSRGEWNIVYCADKLDSFLEYCCGFLLSGFCNYLMQQLI